MWNQSLKEFLKDNSFFLLVGISVFIILVIGIVRLVQKKKGTWSNHLYRDMEDKQAVQRESEGEQRTRAFLESYFNKPFAKARPDFLNNKVTGGKWNLELDCFNPELRLGVEYNGEQHYKFIPFFHGNREKFYNQAYRDEMKRIYCRDSGITLIEIPYTEKHHLEDWLKGKLDELGFQPSVAYTI